MICSLVARNGMTLLNQKPVDHVLQLKPGVSVVDRGAAHVVDVIGIDHQRLVARVFEPVAVSTKFGHAAHEVAIRIARLPVLGIVGRRHRSNVPVEVRAFGRQLHCGSGKNVNRSTVRHQASAGAGRLYQDAV